MALGADRLQVVVGIGAALGLWNNVIDGLRGPGVAGLQAGLTQPLVAAQDALAGLLPLGTIAAFLATATALVGEAAGVTL